MHQQGVEAGSDNEREGRGERGEGEAHLLSMSANTASDGALHSSPLYVTCPPLQP